MDVLPEKDQLLLVGEEVALIVVEKLVFPALDKLAASSDNSIDDAVLAVAKPEILRMIKKIHEPEVPPAA